MSDLVSQVPLAFAAGVLSVLSPCVMPLMPAYLSLISGISVEEMSDGVQDAALRRRVMRACFGFVLGFSTVFVSMGIGAVAVGTHGAYLESRCSGVRELAPRRLQAL